jgi:transcription antitermination protein NusB
MCSMPRNDKNAPVVDVAEQEEYSRSYKDLSRRDIRSLIFHFLYAMESFDYTESLNAIVDNFNRGFDMDVPMDSEAVETARAIIEARNELDATYNALLTNWRFERIGVSTKLILRLAIWELKNTDTDPRIVINESIELAKCFAEKDAFRFINGILDKIVKQKEEEKE